MYSGCSRHSVRAAVEAPADVRYGLGNKRQTGGMPGVSLAEEVGAEMHELPLERLGAIPLRGGAAVERRINSGCMAGYYHPTCSAHASALPASVIPRVPFQFPQCRSVF